MVLIREHNSLSLCVVDIVDDARILCAIVPSWLGGAWVLDRAWHVRCKGSCDSAGIAATVCTSANAEHLCGEHS